MMMRMGDNMAMDMDSGELHVISSWDDEDEDDYKIVINEHRSPAPHSKGAGLRF